MKTIGIGLALLFLTISLAGWAGAEAPHEVVIKVDGMFCPFCTFGIEKRLRALDEAQTVRTDLGSSEAIVVLKPGAEFVENHFADAIKRAGFSQSGITLRNVPPGTGDVTVASIPPGAKTNITSAPGKVGFTFGRTIGGPGKGVGEFNQPMSIAFAPDGWFVVTDSGNARVQQFHPDGRPWRQWTISGNGKTPLGKPVGLAIGQDGDIWVSDYEADTINHYGPDGTPRGAFGGSGKAPGKLDAPSGLAVMPDGHIAVADFYNHVVQLFSPQGKFLRAIGTQGIFRRLRSGGLNYPTRVTASPDGTLYIADAYNYRVAVFREDGEFVRAFGEKGTGPGQVDVSAGIALMSDGTLFVADFMNHRIHHWTKDGNFLGSFGSQGAAPGEFERPIDVALSPAGSLYVVDWGNNRVQVFGKGPE